MRYLLIVMLIVGVFSLRPAHAICAYTLLYCGDSEDSLAWCAYDGSSFWDTIYSASSGYLDTGDSATVECSSSTGCYTIGEIYGGIYACTQYSVSGTGDCNEYACVDGDLSWHSGDSEYSCSNYTCVTD